MPEEFQTTEKKCEQAYSAKNGNPKPKSEGFLVSVGASSAFPSEYASLYRVANCNKEKCSYDHGTDGVSDRESVPIQDAN
jgi:hypothetical protein